MPVAECKRRVSWREFAEWLAFYRRDPWDGFRIDANAALIASTVATMLGRRVVGVRDSLLQFGPRREQTPEELEKNLRISLGLA